MNAIKTQNLTKIYKIPHEKKGTFFETAIDVFKRRISYEKLYALNGVSLEINKGEIVGLIGKNGSGKTTLLKILSGIILPSSGEISVEGRVAPFFSPSLGFNAELTVRENFDLLGVIFNMPKGEIKNRFDKVMDFAGIEKFRDAKLKNLSAGMAARFAFATMVETDPEIMLLDEIFSIGDKEFVDKSLIVLDSYRKSMKTIVFASHSLDIVEKYCDRTILLNHGKLEMFDETKKVIDYYLRN